MALNPSFIMTHLVLASDSPRRVSLLAKLGLHFDIIAPQITERILTAGTDNQIVQTVRDNALQKALSAVSLLEAGLVISGDTLVITDKNKVLGKPITPDEAFSMLNELVGRTHRVISAVAVIAVESQERKVGHEWSKVTFRPATGDELQEYILTNEPIGKAGGYAIQEKGGRFIESIEGSYTAVIGLPIELVVQFLQHFGVQPHYDPKLFTPPKQNSMQRDAPHESVQEFDSESQYFE
ncbi:MAG: Maf family protein [Promethearchaeota archaeon]